MKPTLKTVLAPLAGQLPELLRLHSGTLKPRDASGYAHLDRLGLVDDAGLSRKGQQTLTHLLALANVLDIPYA